MTRATRLLRLHLTLSSGMLDHRPDCGALDRYLSKLNGTRPQLADVGKACRRLRVSCDELAVAVDIGPTGVGPRVGLECHLKAHRPGSYDHLLSDLVDAGVVDPEYIPGVAAWVSAVTLSHILFFPPLPDSLACASRTRRHM